MQLSDLSMNVLFDLLHYSSEIDSLTIGTATGKSVHTHKPQTLAELTQSGRLKR